MKSLYFLGFFLTTLCVFNTSYAGIPNNQCYIKAGQIEGEFNRSVHHSDPETELFVHKTCKPNYCEGGAYQVAVVSSISSFDWHNAPGWAIKEAQKFDFGGNDRVYVDTQTGFYTTLCNNGGVAFSNWKQWINSGTFEPNNNLQCSVNLSVNYINFCGETFDFGTEHYCTYRFFDDTLTQGAACDPDALPIENDHFAELTERYGINPE